LKTEKGWRVERFAVKAAQVLDPGPKSPFEGVWRLTNSPTYLTIREEESGTFKFAESSQPVSDDTEFDARLRSLEGRLEGTFTSYNFRATHGTEFDYTVTLTSRADGKVGYSVKSQLGSEMAEATRVSQ